MAGATGAGVKGGYLVTLSVSKPEGPVGRVVLGPLRFHQRVVFGRMPGCDVVLEHLSISRQHAQLTLDAGGGVFITDLKSDVRVCVGGCLHLTSLVRCACGRRKEVKVQFGLGPIAYTLILTPVVFLPLNP